MGALIAKALVEKGIILAASASTAALVANATIAITSYAYAQRKARQAAAAAASLAGRGREFSLSNTASPRSLIVGRTAVPIERLLFAQTFGDTNEELILVGAFGAHEIDAVEDILFNGVSIGALDSSGYVTGGSFYKSTQRAYTQTIIWPASGTQITLPDNCAAVTSIVETNSGQNIPIELVQGTNYTIHYGTDDQLDYITSTDSTYVGIQFTMTYRANTVKPLVRVKKFLGAAAGERDTELEGLSSKWTSTFVGKEVPRCRIHLIWDANIFGPIGIPDIKFVVRGAKCYDYSALNTTWTRNSARICAWFMQRREGFNASASDIDATLALAAQNACDESVAYGESGASNQARYTCDGVIDSTADPIQNLQQLLGSMVGIAAPVGGKWDLHAGVSETPSYTLEDDDLAGGDEAFQPVSSLSDLFNSVRGRYTDADAGYIVKDAVPYSSSTYVTEDGGQKSWNAIDLPFTTDAYAAQRIQRLQLHLARLSATWKTTYNLGAYPVRAGMTIWCRHTEYGWDSLESGAGKRMLVLERQMNSDGTITLTMREIASAVYDWTYDEATAPDPAPNTTFPDPSYVTPLAGVQVSSDSSSYDTNSTGDRVPYVEVAWTALPAIAQFEATRIVVKWKTASETDYREEHLLPSETSVKLRPVWGGLLLDGFAYVENSLGVRSQYVFFAHRASSDLPSTRDPVSANLITNATFAGGYTGWTLLQESGTTDSVAASKPTNYPISGSPTNIRVDQFGSQFKFQNMQSNPISVTPGRKYAGFVYALGFACETRFQFAFLSSTGAVISYGVSSANSSAATGADPRLPDQYTQLGASAVAPANAVSAVVQMVKFGTSSGGSSSSAFWTRPFFGEVPSGQTALPPWDPGGLSSIYTDIIEPTAITDVVPAGVVSDITITTSSPYYTDREVLRWTPVADGKVEVTIWGMMTGTAGSSTAYILQAGMYATGLSTGGKTSLTMRDVLLVPGSDMSSTSFTITETYYATAGVEAVVYLRGERRTKIAVKPVPPPAPPSGTDTVTYINGRATLIKR